MDLIFLSKSWRKNYAFDLLLEHGIQYLVGNFRLTKSTAVKYLITIGTKVLFYIQRYRSEKGVSNIFYNLSNRSRFSCSETFGQSVWFVAYFYYVIHDTLGKCFTNTPLLCLAVDDQGHSRFRNL